MSITDSLCWGRSQLSWITYSLDLTSNGSFTQLWMRTFSKREHLKKGLYSIALILFWHLRCFPGCKITRSDRHVSNAMTETRCILFGCAIVLLLSGSTTAMARSLPQTFNGHDECAWWYACTSWKTKQCFPSLPLNKRRHAIEFVDSTMAVLALFGSYVTWTLCAI